VFIGLTVVFLASAFYFTYRPRKAASASEDCCAVTPATKSRFSMMTVNKVILWGVTALAVAFLFFPQYMKVFMAGGGAGEPDANNPLVNTTTFSVEGMTCDGCSAVVEKAIKDVPGVVSVKVNYDRKRAVVTSEACCPAPTEAITRAVEAAGYRAALVVPATINTGTTP
jgi:copper chaperone CopZ